MKSTTKKFLEEVVGDKDILGSVNDDVWFYWLLFNMIADSVGENSVFYQDKQVWEPFVSVRKRLGDLVESGMAAQYDSDDYCVVALGVVDRG